MPLVNVVNQLHSDDPLLWLLTVRLPIITANRTVLRAVSNLEDVVSRGETFSAFPFQVTLPPDDGQRIQNLIITFPNVGRELMQVVREYRPTQPPEVLLELVLGNNPNVVEKTIDLLTVQSASYDALAVTFTLSGNNSFSRATSAARYDQREFPGLFWAM